MYRAFFIGVGKNAKLTYDTVSTTNSLHRIGSRKTSTSGTRNAGIGLDAMESQ